jgi:hypothetical protein
MRNKEDSYFFHQDQLAVSSCGGGKRFEDNQSVYIEESFGFEENKSQEDISMFEGLID